MATINNVLIAQLSRPPTVGDNYQGTVVLAAGQTFKIETSPGGEELFSLACSTGEIATIQVRINVQQEAA